MKETCKTCEHWERYADSQFGRCTRCNNWSGLYDRDPGEAGFKLDEFGSRDAEMYFSRLDTGEGFGCIHYSIDLFKLGPLENKDGEE